MGSVTVSAHARALVAAALLLGIPPAAGAQEGAVTLDERLGQQVPVDLVLRDEAGAPVRLGDLLDRPTVLALVYFRCAGICSPLLNGLTNVVERTGLAPGADFRVVTVSFDERDTPPLAEAKKRNYLASLSKGFPPDAWRFLTGDAATTKRLADAVGFGFRREGDDFVHPAVVTVLAPGGKVTRYLYGITFLPFDLKMALVEASEGRAVPTASRILQVCYSWDPGKQRYFLDVTRLAGLATVGLLTVFGAVVILRGGRGGRKEGGR
jgi:protein SCO1/2